MYYLGMNKSNYLGMNKGNNPNPDPNTKASSKMFYLGVRRL